MHSRREYSQPARQNHRILKQQKGQAPPLYGKAMSWNTNHLKWRPVSVSVHHTASLILSGLLAIFSPTGYIEMCSVFRDSLQCAKQQNSCHDVSFAFSLPLYLITSQNWRKNCKTHNNFDGGNPMFFLDRPERACPFCCLSILWYRPGTRCACSCLFSVKNSVP